MRAICEKARFCDDHHIFCALAAITSIIGKGSGREMAMTTMTTSIAPPGMIRTRGHHQPAWRKFLDAVLEPRTLKVEHDIIEYLHHHRHDLPPEVWIELARSRLDL